METQKEPYKDYSPSKVDYMGFHVSLGECILPYTNPYIYTHHITPIV